MCTLGDCNWPSLKLILILVVFRPSGVEFSIFMGLGLIRNVLGFPLFNWVNFTSSTMLGAGKTYLFLSSLVKTFFSAISCDRRLTIPIFLSLGDLGLLKIQNEFVNKQLKCIPREIFIYVPVTFDYSSRKRFGAGDWSRRT